MRLARAVTFACFFVLLCAVGPRAENKMPLTKLGTKAGPTLKFYYCYSCGYRKVFEEYVKVLNKKYPELEINGENYNPSAHNMLIAKILSFAKIFVIILIVSGSDLGQSSSAVWQWCIDNRFYSCIIIFFACNTIEGHLMSSGAFEILLDDVPVWSKLETGRIPQPLELFQIIDMHLGMLYREID